ncbi:MAG: nucleotidyltransferase family protein [Clostridiaceae bacterium]|nr:nucleotidyltransferase family protein [Clostridiaceae bacterium]
MGKCKIIIMETCGIVSEFNPFHRGHRELIRQIREEFSEAVGIVAVMSASFTQRGEPALYDISHRVRTALDEGVDLIIEIPVSFVLNSAESFAQAGIGLLQASGVVRNLAYGSEDSDFPELIKDLAFFLSDEPAEFKVLLDQNIRRGMGFAAARQAAVSMCMANENAGRVLANSNSILAVEYEKAIIRSGKELATHPLPLYQKSRFSASKIRDLAADAVSGRPEDNKANLLRLLHPYMTPSSLAELVSAYQEQEAVVFLHHFAPLLHSQPIWRDRELLATIQGMQNGLADRFVNHLGKLDSKLSAENFSDWLESIATRAFPLSRVRRALLSAMLNISQEDTQNSKVEFLRILGFSKRGQTLLGYMKETASLPVITRSADWQKIDSESGLLQKDLCFTAGNLWKSRLKKACNLEETRQTVRI